MLRCASMRVALLTALLGACGDPAAPPGPGGTGGAEVGEPTPFCEQGSTIECYTGPPGTVGVGACLSGARECSPSGTTFGACVGEVRPGVETCTTPVDDDCDGLVNESGEGCVCELLEEAACYSGPVGAAGVGACKMGTQECLSGDAGFGPCTGDVLPAPEDCVTVADDSCDGSPFDGCPGQVEVIDSIPGWTFTYGIAEHPAGGIVVVGGYLGTISLGGETLTPEDMDAFIVRYDASGNHLWSAGYGGAGTDYFESVTVDSLGRVVASAFQSVPTSWGGAVAAGMGDAQGVVVEYDAFGAFLSQTVVEATGFAAVAVTGIAPNGDWLLSLRFSGEITIGGQTLTGAPGAVTNIVAARWTPGGAMQWMHALAAEPNFAVRLRAHPDGGALIHGHFAQTLELNGTTYVAPTASFGHFYGRLSDDGQTSWLKTFSNGGSHGVAGFNATPTGDVLTAAYRPAMNDFGAGVVPGSWEFALARFDGGGELLWTRVFATPAFGFADLNMASATGQAVTMGFQHEASDIDWGGGSLPLIDGALAVVRFDPAGEALWFTTAVATNLGPAVTTSDGHTWLTAYGGSDAEVGGVPISEGLNVVLLAP